MKPVLLFVAVFLTLFAFSSSAYSDTLSQPAKSKDAKSSTIIVHRPATDPSWGKVIQYQVEQAPANHETLYKFLFQDSDGVVRTAVYHESASGEGYWEVLVWDLQ